MIKLVVNKDRPLQRLDKLLILAGTIYGIIRSWHLRHTIHDVCEYPLGEESHCGIELGHHMITGVIGSSNITPSVPHYMTQDW